MFTYKCGLLEWSGGATIGFYAEGDFYMNHPLSGVNSTQIACVNGDLLWSNVVYSLNGLFFFLSFFDSEMNPFLFCLDLGPLSFLPKSSTVSYLPKVLDGASERIDTNEEGFPFGNSKQYQIYVSFSF